MVAEDGRCEEPIVRTGGGIPEHANRKMNRAMSGTKSRDTKYEYAALLLVLVLIFSGDAAQHYWEEEDDPGEEANDPGGGGRSWEGCRAAQ